MSSQLKSTGPNPCREPNLRLRDSSLDEGSIDRRKTLLIAFSCISLAVAGLFSRESFAEADAALPKQAVRVGATSKAASAEARFARGEIARYQRLTRELKRREGEEAAGIRKEKMVRAIDQLQKNLKLTEGAVRDFESGDGRRDFQLENLKGTLFALQEVGQESVSTFVDIDNAQAEDAELVARYVFSDNRTGQ